MMSIMQKIINIVQTLAKKSKSKCMAILQKKSDLIELKLCGDLLPWVVTGKHLGTRIGNKPSNILNEDMKGETCIVHPTEQ